MPLDFSDSMTVTVVEDEPAVREILVRAARSWRFSCQSASCAEEGAELLEKSPTPILVTDLRMPGKGGIWLVHEVRRRWPEIAIIVVTAGHDSQAAVECLNAGAHRYFLKPIHLEEFHHALDSTLHTYLLERQRERHRRLLERAVRRKTHEVRTTFLSAIDSLVRTMEARDPYTAGHSLRVRAQALRLAKEIGLDQRQSRQLGLAAKLHDVGKVGVPEAILNKPGKLTVEEFRVVQEHPVIGERILTPIVRGPAVLAGIRGHHERLDGRGYPDGLKGDNIPLLARLITIPDCYDALTSSRAYREALSPAEAIEVLREGAGTQFEPAFVQAFATVVTPLMACKA